MGGRGKAKTNRDRVIDALRSAGPPTDAELVEAAGVRPHQQVNQIARALAIEGITIRTKGSRGLIENRLADSPSSRERTSVWRRLRRSKAAASADDGTATAEPPTAFDSVPWCFPDAPPVAGSRPGGPRRIGLVGCVKQKGTRPVPAKDLYESTLFLGRRSFVERTCDEWWILSAEHGLVHPQAELAPYDLALKNLSTRERRAWSHRVLEQLLQAAGPRPGDVIEVHAGAEYREFGLVAGLESWGCVVENPVKGLGIGKQLQFYARAT